MTKGVMVQKRKNKRLFTTFFKFKLFALSSSAERIVNFGYDAVRYKLRVLSV